MSTVRLHTSIFVIFILSLIVTGCYGPEQAEEAVDANAWKHTFFREVYTDSILDIRLAFDPQELIEKANTEKKVKGTVSVHSHGLKEVPVRITARGQSRKRICDFPPIHLNFRKKVNKLHQWSDFGKYKLVTHCLEEDSINHLVFSEYLIYQIYELISPFSLQTQLCRIQYGHTPTKFFQYGFIIEDEDEMANRLGGFSTKVDVSKIRVNKEQYQTLVLFQYMIGNTDWNLNREHNVSWIISPQFENPVIVPYDFDASGFINAPYATPHENLPIEEVRERFFQYRGSKEDDFAPVVETFLRNEAQIYALIENFTYLDAPMRTELVDYIREFYTLIKEADWKDKVFM